MESHLVTKLVERTTVIDKENGKVLDEFEKKHSYLTKNKQKFYLVYASIWSIMEKQLSGPAMKVFAFFASRYNCGAPIGVNKNMREIVAKELEIKQGTVANTLTELTDKKLMYSTEKGVYKINPRHIFQGSTTERNNHLKFVLEVECPDC